MLSPVLMHSKPQPVPPPPTCVTPNGTDCFEISEGALLWGLSGACSPFSSRSCVCVPTRVSAPHLMDAHRSPPSPPMPFSPSPAPPSGDIAIFLGEICKLCCWSCTAHAQGLCTDPPPPPHAHPVLLQRGWVSGALGGELGAHEDVQNLGLRGMMGGEAQWGWGGGPGPQRRVRRSNPVPFPATALGTPFAPRARPVCVVTQGTPPHGTAAPPQRGAALQRGRCDGDFNVQQRQREHRAGWGSRGRGDPRSAAPGFVPSVRWDPSRHFPILCSSSLLLSAFCASLSSRDISRNSRRRWKVRSRELGFPSRLFPACSAREARGGSGPGAAPRGRHSPWGGRAAVGSQRGCSGEQLSEGRKSSTRTEAAEIILSRIAAAPGPGEGGGGPDTCKRGPPRPAPPATLRSGGTRRDEHRGRGSPPRRVRAPHLQAGSPPGNWNQTPLTRPVLRERDSREHRTGPPPAHAGPHHSSTGPSCFRGGSCFGFTAPPA